VPVAGIQVFAQVREGSLEFNVTGEWLKNRAHKWISDVIANSGQVAEANQVALAELLTVAADGRILRMLFGQPNLIPNLQGGSVKAVAPLNIVSIRAAIVEEVEFDQFHTLVLEIEQRAVDAAAIGTQVSKLEEGFGCLAIDVTRCPIVLPVDPGACP